MLPSNSFGSGGTAPSSSSSRPSNENAYARTESFDELKNSRRDAHTQRAKDKIASDLNAIEGIAMMEVLSLHPSRSYGLPIEMEGNRRHIWDLILEHVNDFDTIIHLREVCVMFQEILKRKYIATMIAQVIGSRFLDMGVSWEGGRNGWLKTLVGLRILSKVSKISVDSITNAGLIGKDGTEWFTTHEPHYLIRREVVIMRLGVTQVEMDRLNRRFNLHENENQPEVISPVSSVMIDEVGQRLPLFAVAANQNLQIHRDSFRRLFEKMIGKNITSFYYKTIDNSFETYANLLSWVIHMPNLQDLIINLEGITLLRPWEVTGRMAVEPFPTCPHLKRYAEGPKGFGVPFSREILRANPTIQEVLLGNVSKPSAEWGNVKEMLNNVHLTKFYSVSMPDNQFFRHRFLWAQQLVTLALWEPCPIIRLLGDINSNVLFNFISTFMNLKKLMVSTPYIRDTGGYLNLLKLKHLVWGVFPTFKTLKFLDPAEGLESLDLDVSMCADTKLSWKALKFLEEWNVPSLFPVLRKIRLRTEKDGRFMTIWTSGSA